MAGHGSPPAEDKGNHPSRRVDRSDPWVQSLANRVNKIGPGLPENAPGIEVREGRPSRISTQPRAMPQDKYRSEPNVVQRVRRAREGGSQPGPRAKDLWH
jgi:hypothetical protein